MMTFIEAVDSEWAQKQLQIADKEIELQKQEWEENQKRQQREEQEQSKLVQDDDDQEILTISRDETANKVRLKKSLHKKKPIVVRKLKSNEKSISKSQPQPQSPKRKNVSPKKIMSKKRSLRKGVHKKVEVEKFRSGRKKRKILKRGQS